MLSLLPLLLAPMLASPAGNASCAARRVSPLPWEGCARAPEPLFDGSRPSPCPDGNRLVYIKGRKPDRDIVVRDLAAGIDTVVAPHKADDADPDFLPGCRQVVFSSNRKGSYDLWLADLAAPDKPPTRITSLPGDETRPDASPLLHKVDALFVTQDGTAPPTPAAEMERFAPILFVHSAGKRVEILRTAADGRRPATVATGCDAAAFTHDGLGLALRCGTEVRMTRYRLPDPAAAVAKTAWASLAKRTAKLPRGQAGLDKAWQDRKWPRLEADFTAPRFAHEAAAVHAVVPSANGLLLVGTDDQGSILAASAAGREAWRPLGTDLSGADPAWSADGRYLYFWRDEDGSGRIYRAPTACPLQDATDLLAWPELFEGGIPSSLADNGFVARDSTSVEPADFYQEAAASGRGLFITADAVLQAFSDLLGPALELACSPHAPTAAAECPPPLDGTADTLAFQRLTHPSVPDRDLPSLLDVLVALGATRAADLVHPPEGTTWTLDAWRTAASALLQEIDAARARCSAPGPCERLHRIPALVAADTVPRGSRVPEALRSPAWSLRTLFAAAAACLQVHSYAPPCAARPPMPADTSPPPPTALVFLESPVLPEPTVYVEPNADLYLELAALARALAPDDPVASDFASFAALLAAASEAELAGLPVRPEQVAELRQAHKRLAQAARGNRADPDPGDARGESGMVRIRPLFTSAASGRTLYAGTGKVLSLYVAIPDGPGTRIAIGVMTSVYEIPSAEPLDNSSWWEMVDSRPEEVQPLIPPCARSFWLY